MNKINVESIRTGDEVGIMIHGAAVSGMWRVKGVTEVCVFVALPTGAIWIFKSAITAHEPALPDWWRSQVILASGRAYGRNYLVYDSYADDYMGLAGVSRSPEFFEAVDVTVIVDRDGNQPAAEGYRTGTDPFAALDTDPAALRVGRDYYGRMWREAEADLAAFRAEVEKVRDFLAARADEHLRQEDSFARGAAYVGHGAASRLTAILDGDDQ